MGSAEDERSTTATSPRSWAGDDEETPPASAAAGARGLRAWSCQQEAASAAGEMPAKLHSDRRSSDCVDKITESLCLLEDVWGEAEALQVEAFIDATVRRGAAGGFSGVRTVNKTPLRTKYFFGCGYTYGSGRRGQEELLPMGMVDAVPSWIHRLVVQPLVERGVVREGWVDSAVLNDYQAGGSIVAHIDPPQLFARPLLVASFFDEGRLVFDASFDPDRLRPPAYEQHLPRASVLVMNGYAANEVTHGMRPEDMFGSRRVSIVLRHVLENAPVMRSITPIDVDGRSQLIRAVQGNWRSPCADVFYNVQQLRVVASGWPVNDPDAEENGVTVWRLQPVEHGLICGGGILHFDGVGPYCLVWKPLRRQDAAQGFSWTWIRVQF